MGRVREGDTMGCGCQSQERTSQDTTFSGNTGECYLYTMYILTYYIHICIYLMSHTMKFIPVGIVYATWAGLGIVGITIIAVIKYKQIPNIPTIIGLFLIVIGVTIVHLMNDIDVK